MGKVMVAQLRQNALSGKALKLRVKDKAGKVEVRTLESVAQPVVDESDLHPSAQPKGE